MKFNRMHNQIQTEYLRIPQRKKKSKHITKILYYYHSKNMDVTRRSKLKPHHYPNPPGIPGTQSISNNPRYLLFLLDLVIKVARNHFNRGTWLNFFLLSFIFLTCFADWRRLSILALIIFSPLFCFILFLSHISTHLLFQIVFMCIIFLTYIL